MLKVKVTLMSAKESEIRRTTLENDPDFAELERKVSELFGETTGSFTFHWKDDEGDLITMSSSEEFQEVMKGAAKETLRIFLRRIEDQSKSEGGMEFNDDNPGNEQDTLTPEEYGTRSWGSRRRYWRGLGQGQGPLPLRRFRKAEQHPENDQSLSERRMRRFMRRKFETRERFDQPRGSIDRFRSRCGSRRNAMPSEDCLEKTGSFCRWNGNYWRRRCNQHSVRHLKERLDDAYMARGSCRSRRRNRECCPRRRCCKRANSAPTTRRFGRNLNDFGMMMRGKRCRRSTSVPVCRQEKDDEIQVSPICRQSRFQNAKIWLKIKEDGSPTHVCESFTDSASGEEKRCHRRRCKSYRRRAAMLGNETSKKVNDSASKNKHDEEPGISELVETMTIEEDKEGTEESDAGTKTTEEGKEGTEERDTGTGVSRRRNCRYRRHRGEDDETDENNQSEETKKRKYHCKHRCGRKKHSGEAQETPAKNWEMNEEDEMEAKRQRKCKIKVNHQSMDRDGSTKCRNTKEHGVRILTLKVRMNDEGMRPRKLARKLVRILNQYSADCQENRPWGRRCGREFRGRPRGNDFERQIRRRLRRQRCRQGRVRFLSPEFPGNVEENIACYGPRRIRPRDCPW
ncbi:uncharacterized protein LOC134271859 [Saccostrea cucullata]|uniref:uncharacterized protein LOC134271859 n=1 Tax=Saccostrea cuccullata TaxID=36930 RepID=UPI002ED41568